MGMNFGPWQGPGRDKVALLAWFHDPWLQRLLPNFALRLRRARLFCHHLQFLPTSQPLAQLVCSPMSPMGSSSYLARPAWAGLLGLMVAAGRTRVEALQTTLSENTAQAGMEPECIIRLSWLGIEQHERNPREGADG